MQEKFMARAIEIARESVDAPGTLPYGAVVVMDGKIVGEGVNRVAANFDPTSHGEVEAIRDDVSGGHCAALLRWLGKRQCRVFTAPRSARQQMGA